MGLGRMGVLVAFILLLISICPSPGLTFATMETEQGGNWMSPLPPGRQQRLCLFSYLGFFTQFEKFQIHRVLLKPCLASNGKSSITPCNT